MKIKDLAKNLMLIMVSLLVTVLIAEVLVRIFWAAPKFRYPQTLHRHHEILGWEMVPNQKSYTWGIPVSINSHGLRDDEFSKKKPDGTDRILVLGDSVTFGVAVEGEETYSNQLEKLLNERHPKKTYEVINSGVQRYFTYQQVDYLRLRGVEFEPDTVVLGFYVNDLGIRPEKWEREYENEREKFMNKLSSSVPFLMTIVKNSAFISLARDRFLRLQHANRKKPNPRQKLLTGVHDEKMEKLWAATREYLSELKSLAEQHKFKILIAAFPGVNQVVLDFPDSNYPAKLEAIAKEMDLCFVDILEVFKKHYTGDLRSLHFRYDGHPNARAHRLAAEAIYEKALDCHVIPVD